MTESTTNPKIDNYLAEGCGRCPLVSTPDCKVNHWREELIELRAILHQTQLTEELKWSVPCYTYNSANVLLLSAFNNYCSLSFFKGVLLDDPEGVLVKQGQNSQAARLLKFTDADTVRAMESTIKAYVQNAIEVEKAGLKVEFKKIEDYDFPEELLDKFDDDPALQAAFESLTPGRQKSYLLHISSAKQSKTRISRIEKCVPKIFAGKGFHDR